ncbi:hypothetical protein [Spirosoma endophyticum]|uniref:Uncharacterized protein n=1 Tax=Spirosoma endophyticum TaxID=662367 RepID=A0A1I1LVL5_9BACT|nr:hypothetical protein [Spirosoma endophyticum]SFC77131.1 hypothetical protein SAMN05216167_102364 [Spirosoma endophyticum]
METKTTRTIILILLAFLGLGAIGGGGVLIVSPSGELMGMPLSLLDRSPFTNFLVPGLFLFGVLGLVPCLLVVALLKKPASKAADQLNFFSDMHWSWTCCIYVAIALIIWIQIEMVVIYGIHWSQTFYMFLAITILFVALLPGVRNLYKK